MKCWTLIVVLSAPSNFRLLTSESDDHEPSKHVLNELSSTTESLRQVSLEKNAALKLISELTLSVSHPALYLDGGVYETIMNCHQSQRVYAKSH